MSYAFSRIGDGDRLKCMHGIRSSKLQNPHNRKAITSIPKNEGWKRASVHRNLPFSMVMTSIGKLIRLLMAWLELKVAVPITCWKARATMQSSFLMSLMISMSVMVHITAIIKTYNNKNNNNLSLCVSERCYDIQKFHGRVSAESPGLRSTWTTARSTMEEQD